MFDLQKVEKVFIVGIKGVAMANIAVILKKMGKEVSGSDVDDSFITDDELQKNGISVQIGFETLPQEIDLVLYSASHKGSQNPQVLEAKKHGIQVMHQAEFLGELLKQFETSIAICGTHGKTTTASLMGHALIELGTHPSYLVGAPSFGEHLGGDYEDKKYFVIEADEYAVDPPTDKTPKFQFLHPSLILCTNVDLDHPDVYETHEEVQNAFEKFYTSGKKVIKSDQIIVSDYQSTPDGSRFTIAFNNQKIENIDTSLFGEKNAHNAALVIAGLLYLGFDGDDIKRAIKSFNGVKRRFEQVYEQDGTYLFDDYAHHPAEIAAVISAARGRFEGKRIHVLFQPHTYSRTRMFADEFLKSLALADFAYIAPIFASAREANDSFELRSTNPHVKVDNSTDELMADLKQNLRKGDIVFTMGAGDIYKLADGIIRIIASL